MIAKLPAIGGRSEVCRSLPALYAEVKGLLRERDQYALAEIRARALVQALDPQGSPSRLRRERGYLRTVRNQVAALDARIQANNAQRRTLLQAN